MASVAGYSILNDISARDWVPEEERSYFGLDWVMLKGFDGAAPMGPFITPADFVQAPQVLTLTLTVNGQVKQHSNTASMVFSIQEIIEHLTIIMTLEPGDVIAPADLAIPLLRDRQCRYLATVYPVSSSTSSIFAKVTISGS